MRSSNGYYGPNIHSYESIAAFWNKRTKRRRDPNTTLLTGSRDTKLVTRYVHGSGIDYAVTHHGTDVVTYHWDGEVTINMWDSVTSSAIIRNTKPMGVEYVIASGQRFVKGYLREGMKITHVWYHTPDEVRLKRNSDGDWMPQETRPIEIIKLDRKAFNAAERKLPHKFSDLQDHINAYRSLMPSDFKLEYVSEHEWMSIIMEGEQEDWNRLARSIFYIDTIMSKLRRSFVAKENLVATTEVPYLVNVSSEQVKRIVRNNERF